MFCELNHLMISLYSHVNLFFDFDHVYFDFLLNYQTEPRVSDEPVRRNEPDEHLSEH